MLSPLEVAEDRVGDGGEAEGDLETDVAAEWAGQHTTDWTYVPCRCINHELSQRLLCKH